VTNIRLERVDDARIRGVVGVIVHGVKTGLRDKYVEFVGEYRDDYVRTEAGWRFERRDLVDLADLKQH
jgi:hypothetical protein